MKIETWRSIPGFENSYRISTHGRVQALEREINRRNKFGVVHTTLRKEKILSPKKRAGYLSVQLSTEFSTRKMYLIHRLVAKTFISNPENKPQVNHKDGDKTNNHVDNLEWATRSENQLHRYRVLKR